MSRLAAFRQPIPEIIKRHAGDAAFYWSQWSKARYSFIVNAERLAHIEHLLCAHLDGLTEAADTGWQEAFGNLKRWKGPGETFVCVLLALQHDSQERFTLMWPTLEANAHDCARGFISALAWQQQRSPSPTPWLDHWLKTADSPLLTTVALRASACVGQIPLEHATTASQADSAHVRAAACRTLARHPNNPEAAATLLHLTNNTAPNVAIEAAIGLLHQGGDSATAQQALNALHNAILAALPSLTALKGSKRRNAYRQLRRWLFYWAFYTPIKQREFAVTLEQLPPLLQIEAIGWHGDSAHVDHLIKMMHTPELAPAALAHLELLTGCDAEDLHLTAPIDQAQLDTAQNLPPEYQAMPFPNVAAVTHWWQAQQPIAAATKVLQGKPLEQNQTSLEHCQTLIAIAPRRIARIAQQHCVVISVSA
ncbi:hypothetical protein [Gilvimarinus japonicus]|uniref:TIGR02270 family protein n=1 Tax=Gilvimarinus japonicus TaxID=1796469 RepID=A0ABV7HP33_9GAMM